MNEIFWIHKWIHKLTSILLTLVTNSVGWAVSEVLFHWKKDLKGKKKCFCMYFPQARKAHLCGRSVILMHSVLWAWKFHVWAGQILYESKINLFKTRWNLYQRLNYSALTIWQESTVIKKKSCITIKCIMFKLRYQMKPFVCKQFRVVVFFFWLLNLLSVGQLQIKKKWGSPPLWYVCLIN